MPSIEPSSYCSVTRTPRVRFSDREARHDHANDEDLLHVRCASAALDAQRSVLRFLERDMFHHGEQSNDLSTRSEFVGVA